MPKDLTQQERREADLYRLLRQIYARALFHGTPHDPREMTEAEISTALMPFGEHMLDDIRVLGVIMNEARVEGMATVYGRIRKAPGTDLEMLDQVMETGAEPGDVPAMEVNPRGLRWY